MGGERTTAAGVRLGIRAVPSSRLTLPTAALSMSFRPGSACADQVRVREFEAAVTAGDAQARALGDTIFDSHIKAARPPRFRACASAGGRLTSA